MSRPVHQVPDSGQRQVSQWEWHRRAMLHAVVVVCDAWPRALEDLAAVGYPRGRGLDAGGHGSGGIVVDGVQVPATGVEIAALNPHLSVAWVAELHDVIQRLLVAAQPAATVFKPPQTAGDALPVLEAAVETIFGTWHVDDLIDADPHSANYHRDVFGLYRLADDALRYWPPPAGKGDQIGAVTVGERGNQIDVCGLCGDPAPGGRDPQGRLLRRRIDNVVYHNTAAPGREACFWQVWRQRRRRTA